MDCAGSAGGGAKDRHVDARRRASRVLVGLLRILVCGLTLAACSFPGSLKPTLKVGLSGPFEGSDRAIGYQVLHATRLAVRQRNEAGGLADRYLVELVALNDFDEAEVAVVQARKMAADEAILGVLGGLSPEGAREASAEYHRLGLAFLTPDTDLVGLLAPAHADAAFLAEYEALSGGEPPSEAAVWAYGAANRLMDAMDAAIRTGASSLRQNVLAALRTGS